MAETVLHAPEEHLEDYSNCLGITIAIYRKSELVVAGFVVGLTSKEDYQHDDGKVNPIESGAVFIDKGVVFSDSSAYLFIGDEKVLAVSDTFIKDEIARQKARNLILGK